MNKAIKLCCILLVIVLAAAAGWWGTRPYLYMEASGVIITAVPAKADLPFDIKFIHSVQKTPVEEYLVEQESAEQEDDGFEEAENNKEDAEEMEE